MTGAETADVTASTGMVLDEIDLGLLGRALVGAETEGRVLLVLSDSGRPIGCGITAEQALDLAEALRAAAALSAADHHRLTHPDLEDPR